jgi:hypothetical protein
VENYILLVPCPNTLDNGDNRPLLDVGRRIAVWSEEKKIETSQMTFFFPRTTPGRKTLNTLLAGISSTAVFNPNQMQSKAFLEIPSPESFSELHNTSKTGTLVNIFITTKGFICAYAHWLVPITTKEISLNFWRFVDEPTKVFSINTNEIKPL